MPRFFFDISVGARHARDDFGIELASAEVAREQAEAVMPQIVDEAPSCDHPEAVTLTVRDEEGNLIFEERAVAAPRSDRF